MLLLRKDIHVSSEFSVMAAIIEMMIFEKNDGL